MEFSKNHAGRVAFNNEMWGRYNTAKSGYDAGVFTVAQTIAEYGKIIEWVDEKGKGLARGAKADRWNSYVANFKWEKDQSDSKGYLTDWDKFQRYSWIICQMGIYMGFEL